MFSGRVSPETMKFLKKIPGKPGRRIDWLVGIITTIPAEHLPEIARLAVAPASIR